MPVLGHICNRLLESSEAKALAAENALAEYNSILANAEMQNPLGLSLTWAEDLAHEFYCDLEDASSPLTAAQHVRWAHLSARFSFDGMPVPLLTEITWSPSQSSKVRSPRLHGRMKHSMQADTPSAPPALWMALADANRWVMTNDLPGAEDRLLAWGAFHHDTLAAKVQMRLRSGYLTHALFWSMSTAMVLNLAGVL